MRTQISLTPEQHAGAKEKAAGLGITMAEYIRRLVARDLESASPAADPSSIFGIGASGGSDIAVEKDQAVGTAVEGAWAERRP